MTESITTTARRMDEAEKARRERSQDNIASALATRAARVELVAREFDAEAFAEFAARFPGKAGVNVALLWSQRRTATDVDTRQSWPFRKDGPRRVYRSADPIWQLHIDPSGRLRAVEVYDVADTDAA